MPENEKNRSLFAFSGGISHYGKWIGNWTGETVAPSPARAVSNLVYQYKKENRLNSQYQISLEEGKLKKVA